MLKWNNYVSEEWRLMSWFIMWILSVGECEVTEIYIW